MWRHLSKLRLKTASFVLEKTLTLTRVKSLSFAIFVPLTQWSCWIFLCNQQVPTVLLVPWHQDCSFTHCHFWTQPIYRRCELWESLRVSRLGVCFPRLSRTRAHSACTQRGVVVGHAGLLSIAAGNIRQDIGWYTQCRAACSRSNGSRSCSLAGGSIDSPKGHVLWVCWKNYVICGEERCSSRHHDMRDRISLRRFAWFSYCH